MARLLWPCKEILSCVSVSNADVELWSSCQYPTERTVSPRRGSATSFCTVRLDSVMIFRPVFESYWPFTLHKSVRAVEEPLAKISVIQHRKREEEIHFYQFLLDSWNREGTATRINLNYIFRFLKRLFLSFPTCLFKALWRRPAFAIPFWVNMNVVRQ